MIISYIEIILPNNSIAQLAGCVEYTDCIFAVE